MGRNIGSFVPSQNAQNNLIATLVAIEKLKESQQRGKYLDELRKETSQKRELESQQLEQKMRETNYTSAVQGAGLDPKDLEVQGAMFGTRQMTQPGAQALATTGRVTQQPDQVTQIPNIYPHIARPTDVAAEAQRGAQGLREGGLASLRRLDVKPEDAAYREAAEGGRIITSGKAPEFLKERESVTQQRAKSIEDTVKANIAKETEKEAITGAKGKYASEEAKGKVDVESVKPDIRKRHYDAVNAEAEAKIKTANAFQANENARNDANIKASQAALERAKVSGIPTAMAKAEEDLTHAKLQNTHTQQTIDQHNAVTAATAEYNKAVIDGDPVAARTALQKSSAAAGHANVVLSDNLAVQKEQVDLQQKAVDLRVGALALTKQGNLDEAKRAYETANSHLVRAARYGNSDSVTLTTMHDTPGGMLGLGAPTANTGSINVPIEIAELHVNGMLQQIAEGKMKAPDWLPPARALAWDVGIKRAYAVGDMAAYNRGVSESMADPVTKDQALKMGKSITDKQKPPVVPIAPTLAPSTSVPLPTDVGRGAAERTRIEKESETTEKQSTTRKNIESIRSQERAQYIARKAQEAGLTPVQASQAQIKKWTDEFNKSRGVTLRAAE